MRYCPSCKVNIEGVHFLCPLCQNELQGEPEERIYPSMKTLKKMSLLYKLQLFIQLSAMLVCVAMEFLLDVTASFHWSLLVVTWVIGGQVWLHRIIKRRSTPSKIITSIGWWTAVLVFLTFLILDLRPIYLTWILPGIVVLCAVLHFIFMMIDKAQNAMVYLLGCSLLCVVTGVGLILYMHEINILWVISILTGIITFIGAVIFKGRGVTSELEKRFHI